MSLRVLVDCFSHVVLRASALYIHCESITVRTTYALTFLDLSWTFEHYFQGIFKDRQDKLQDCRRIYNTLCICHVNLLAIFGLNKAVNNVKMSMIPVKRRHLYYSRTFQGPMTIFKDFQALKKWNCKKSRTFKDFKDPCKPCNLYTNSEMVFITFGT